MTTEISEDRPGLRFRHFLALALGGIIGVGWIAVAPAWVSEAGAIGASLAFLAAAFLLLPVGIAYARLAHRYPHNGGAVIYAEKFLGSFSAYLVGHLVLLSFLSAIVYFSILLSELVGQVFSLDTSTQLLEAWRAPAGWLTVLCITGLLAYVNFRGSRTSAGIQVIALSLLIIGCLIFAVYGFIAGTPNRIHEATPSVAGLSFGGFLAVFMVAPWFLSGFESIAQVVGERSSTLNARRIAQVIATAIFGACLFYVIIISATASLAVTYDTSLEGFALLDLVSQVSSTPFLNLVILGMGVLGVLTGWNAYINSCLRTFEVMADRGFLPSAFNRNAEGTSSILALFVVSACPLIGLGLGIDRLDPVLEAGSLSVVALFFVVCLSFLKAQRKWNGEPSSQRYRLLMPVMSVAITLLFLVVVAFVPIIEYGGLPPQWICMLILSAAALLHFIVFIRNRGAVHVGS
ncbi:MAG: APC family permease [Pseudomonadota bacterium]